MKLHVCRFCFFETIFEDFQNPWTCRTAFCLLFIQVLKRNKYWPRVHQRLSFVSLMD